MAMWFTIFLIICFPTIHKFERAFKRFFQAPSTQTFELLAHIGRDCVGAIQLCAETIEFSKKIITEPLTKKDIAAILKKLRQLTLRNDG